MKNTVGVKKKTRLKLRTRGMLSDICSTCAIKEVASFLQ